MKLYISAGSQRIRTRKLFNESWLLESWTAKHGGSELVAVVTVMPFNSCAVASGFGILAIVFKIKKKGTPMTLGIHELYFLFL
jgi:hypothetical protein